MTAVQIRTPADLESALSTPIEDDIACLRRLEGDILILGAAGKMGPSMARLCRNAADAAGRPRRIIAVSRSVTAQPGVEAISCDLLQRDQVVKLPDCPNVLYLAGRKFGSSGNPELTWAMNALVPATVAERFQNSRIVAFSTGNVYPFREVQSGGSVETDALGPVGEYAQSCLARERVFEYFAGKYGTQVLLFRLNYAVDLRYGVIVDIARKVYSEEPVDVGVPAFNVIWQRDANSYALRSLEFCDSPPRPLNVTGAETLQVRAVANWFAERFRKPCRFRGTEGATALLSNASACFRLMGPPTVSSEQLMEMAAAWIEGGGSSLDKPTHFEVADGKF